jgi:hypothetical protein
MLHLDGNADVYNLTCIKTHQIMKVIFKYESYPAKGHLNDKIFREGMNQN